MRVLRGIGMLATCRQGLGQGDIHPIHDAALAWDGPVVRWVGPAGDLPSEFRDAPSEDAGGRLVVPGLVDCHTHLAFGGWRAGEFERRVRGDSYLDIARDGGGIASTMRATRAASEDELVARALGFLQEMLRLGVEGKAAGWRTLRVLAETDTRLDAGRLDELISRARRQADLLEELRVRAAGQVIGLGATTGDS